MGTILGGDLSHSGVQVWTTGSTKPVVLVAATLALPWKFSATSTSARSWGKNAPRRATENELAQPRMAVAAHHDEIRCGVGDI
jgi:hypothetical protein